jgi:hypothetical protein
MADRLANEYQLEVIFEPSPHAEARWLGGTKAEIEDFAAIRRQALKRQFDQQFRIRPRNQYRGSHHKLAAVKLAMSDQVSDRLASGTTRNKWPVVLGLSERQLVITMRDQPGLVTLQHMTQQHTGLQPADDPLRFRQCRCNRHEAPLSKPLKT